MEKEKEKKRKEKKKKKINQKKKKKKKGGGGGGENQKNPQVLKTFLPFHLFIRRIKTTRSCDSFASTQNVKLICLNKLTKWEKRQEQKTRYRSR